MRFGFFGYGVGGSVLAEAVLGTGDGGGGLFLGIGVDECAFAFANEGEFLVVAIPIHADEVADAHLLGGEKIGEGIDEVAFNGALEVARAVALVGAFLQEEIAAAIGDAKEEFAVGGFEDAPLHEAEFDVEDGFEFGAFQGMKDDELVEAVHKFGREFAAGGLQGGAFDFLIEVGDGLVVGFYEAVAALHEVGDIGGAEVGGHEDDGLREVYAAIVAEGESGFVEHAEEQLPKGVAGLFDFVEEQERHFELVGMIGGKRFLGN